MKGLGQSLIAYVVVSTFLISMLGGFMLSTTSTQVKSLPVSSMTTPSAGTRFFNLTFIENKNFTSNIGNFTTVAGTQWTISDNAMASGSDSYVYDITKTVKDSLITIDYQIAADSILNVYLRWTSSTYPEVNASAYCLTLAPSNDETNHKAVELLKWYAGDSVQSNWYYNSAVYSGTGWNWPALIGNHYSTQLYNGTWMRAIIGIVGNDYSATWSNLTERNSNSWRMSIQDKDAAAGVKSISSGHIGFRSPAGTAAVRQILYDYPNFPISIKAGQKVSVHLWTTNWTSASIIGTPTKGSLQNGYWNFTSTLSDIGIWNETFYCVNGTKNITKHVLLSVFPDLSSYGQWNADNPVVENGTDGVVSSQIYDPCVINDGNSYTMYVGVVTSFSPLVLRPYRYLSLDGIHWTDATDLTSITDNQRDKLAVLKEAWNKYDMVTGAFNRSGLYYYSSSNGITWYQGNGGVPILTPTLSWEQGAIQSPSLLLKNGIYYVFYAAGKDPSGSMYEPRIYGMAYGASLLSLTKYPYPLSLSAIDSRGNFSYTLGSLKPRELSNGIYMAIVNGFDQSPSPSSHASLALSNDLIHWYAYPEVAAFPVGMQTWETTRSFTGSWLKDSQGAIAFWFNGATAFSEQVGMVTYLPPGISHFDIITPTQGQLGLPISLHPYISLILVLFGFVIAMPVVGFALNVRNKRVSRHEFIDLIVYVVIGLILMTLLVIFLGPS